jgi:hypothetical protein
MGRRRAPYRPTITPGCPYGSKEYVGFEKKRISMRDDRNGGHIVYERSFGDNTTSAKCSGALQ